MFTRKYLWLLFIICISAAPVSAQSAGVVETNPVSLEEFWSIGTVNSLVIEKNNNIIIEEYAGGMNADEPANIKSASKSILSLLVGIAIDKGYLESVDQSIGEFFPEYFEANPDSQKESITIEDLLTMRSGLETTSRWNYGPWVVSNNWVDYALSQPLEDEPGTKMNYSTGSSHLLSVILTKASGMSTKEFANRYLLEPLNTSAGWWDTDPQGYYMGGNNLLLTPSALLKIGRMVMNGGTYQEEQIVPAEWINESLKFHTESLANPYDYGYMWWRTEINGYDMAFAWGNGGQYIMTFPELDSVIVITSNVDESDGSRLYEEQIFSFLEDKLIPLLENEGVQ
ncbi:MAG: serine hydrolase [Balneolaceae bacterium]